MIGLFLSKNKKNIIRRLQTFICCLKKYNYMFIHHHSLKKLTRLQYHIRWICSYHPKPKIKHLFEKYTMYSDVQ